MTDAADRSGDGPADRSALRELTTPRTETFRDLGTTPLALQLGLTTEQTNGHWCSRCEGIWFGYTLEVECPVCGNRKG